MTLPLGACALIELAGAAVLFRLAADRRRYSDTHLTPDSVKEAVDLLPSGILAGEKSGRILLANLEMEALSRQLGVVLSDTGRFWEDVVKAGTVNGESRIVRFPGERTVRFSRSGIRIDGRECVQVTAEDMTEQYRLTAELEEKNRRLQEIQHRLQLYELQTGEMIRSQEILNAKTIVHSEVGHVLLTARYFLEHPEQVDPDALLAILKRTNEFLLREAEDESESPEEGFTGSISDACVLAGSIGVHVNIAGQEPADPLMSRIAAQAVFECAANTVKHAGGDRVNVVFRKTDGAFTAEFTNSGTAPRGELRETGGLLSLRLRTEEAGGTMMIAAEPEFRLTITFPASGDTAAG